MANRILPAVKRYAVGTQPVREAAKVCSLSPVQTMNASFSRLLRCSPLSWRDSSGPLSTKPLPKSAYPPTKITALGKSRQKMGKHQTVVKQSLNQPPRSRLQQRIRTSLRVKPHTRTGRMTGRRLRSRLLQDRPLCPPRPRTRTDRGPGPHQTAVSRVKPQNPCPRGARH